MLYKRAAVKFRHELKHRLNDGEAYLLSKQLQLVLQRDDHSDQTGNYQVNSLYFDSLQDDALMEKINGVNLREKFRIRYYNQDPSFIRLEKKIKKNGLCAKRYASLNQEEVLKIIAGEIDFLLQRDDPLLIEFYSKLKGKQIKPAVIVYYQREAYRFLPGNVRVTLDRYLRMEKNIFNFFDLKYGQAVDLPVTILEVKYDEFLPEIVAMLVQGISSKTSTYSKFAAGRLKNW